MARKRTPKTPARKPLPTIGSHALSKTLDEIELARKVDKFRRETPPNVAGLDRATFLGLIASLTDVASEIVHDKTIANGLRQLSRASLYACVADHFDPPPKVDKPKEPVGMGESEFAKLAWRMP
jgi:hypothetical protein